MRWIGRCGPPGRATGAAGRRPRAFVRCGRTPTTDAARPGAGDLSEAVVSGPAGPASHPPRPGRNPGLDAGAGRGWRPSRPRRHSDAAAAVCATANFAAVARRAPACVRRTPGVHAFGRRGFLRRRASLPSHDRPGCRRRPASAVPARPSGPARPGPPLLRHAMGKASTPLPGARALLPSPGQPGSSIPGCLRQNRMRASGIDAGGRPWHVLPADRSGGRRRGGTRGGHAGGPVVRGVRR